MRAMRRGLRSTLWKREGGQLVRQYHDTGVWSDPSATDEERVFTAAPAQSPPAHLQNVMHILVHRRPSTLCQVATLCGVEESTAWCYVTRAIEFWPLLCREASKMVFPGLVEKLDRIDRSGPLRTVMERLQPALEGDQEWKCIRNRYAHLRLARVCLDARDLIQGKGE